MKIQMESQAIEFSYKKKSLELASSDFCGRCWTKLEPPSHDFVGKTITGGIESRRNYLSGMKILII